MNWIHPSGTGPSLIQILIIDNLLEYDNCSQLPVLPNHLLLF